MAATRSANRFGTKTGTTTASYVEALRVDLRGFGTQGKFIAFLKNTGATNTMYYKVDLYLHGSSDSAETDGQLTKVGKAQTSIATSTQIEITTTEVPYNCIVVISVVNNAGATTYQLDWTTY